MGVRECALPAIWVAASGSATHWEGDVLRTLALSRAQRPQLHPLGKGEQEVRSEATHRNELRLNSTSPCRDQLRHRRRDHPAGCPKRHEQVPEHWGPEALEQTEKVAWHDMHVTESEFMEEVVAAAASSPTPKR